jgi:hypothetical protein
MKEWSATKKMADAIKDRREKEEFEFDLDEGCTFGCKLPARYGLPCRHWMYAAVVDNRQLPLSLFYPRLHFDGPPVLRKR